MNTFAANKAAELNRQVERAETFADLHRPGDPLLLANVWDVGSVVAIFDVGAWAIATTSAAVARDLSVYPTPPTWVRSTPPP